MRLAARSGKRGQEQRGRDGTQEVVRNDSPGSSDVGQIANRPRGKRLLPCSKCPSSSEELLSLPLPLRLSPLPCLPHARHRVSKANTYAGEVMIWRCRKRTRRRMKHLSSGTCAEDLFVRAAQKIRKSTPVSSAIGPATVATVRSISPAPPSPFTGTRM